MKPVDARTCEGDHSTSQQLVGSGDRLQVIRIPADRRAAALG
jgi:hypothetical protein